MKVTDFLLKRPTSVANLIGFSYLLIGPMILLIPSDVFTLYPWTRIYTDWMGSVVPVIDRVAAYGYADTDRLRFYLAYVWTCMPVLIWRVWGFHLGYNKPYAWGPDAASFWTRWVLCLLFVAFVLFFIWYWPNFPLNEREILGPLEQPHDKRKGLFASTPALILASPLWAIGFASFVDILWIECKNASRLLASDNTCESGESSKE